MPRSGTGNYNLPATNPVATGTQITTGWANPTMADIAAELTNSLPRDGQAPPTNNLQMGGFKLTGLGNATARDHAVNLGQIADGGYQYLTGVTGTDSISATLTPAPTNYTAGQIFYFYATGVNSTSLVTLNINGLGAKNLVLNTGASLPIGTTYSGMLVKVTYDGSEFIVGYDAASISVESAGTVADIASMFRKWVAPIDPRFVGIVGGSWHTAINAAAAYALTNKLGVRLLPDTNGHNVTGPVVIPAGVPFDMRGTYLNYTGTIGASMTVLTIGTAGTPNLYMPMLGLDVRNGASTSAWTSPTTAWPRTLTSITATTTSGSNQLTSVTGTPAVGQLLVGAGIPFGTMIASGAGATWTMTQNATASASGVSISAETINSGFTGIEIIEANHCEIEHVSSQKFTRGLVESSYTKPFAYNKRVRYGLFQDCKYGLMLQTVGTNGGTQFVNENASTGGAFENSSTSNAWGDSVGVVITRDITNNSYPGQNNNKFRDPCFELGSSTPYYRIPVWLCSAGGNNKFIDCRGESNDGWAMVIDGGAAGLALIQNEFFSSFDNSVAQSYQNILELNGAVGNHYYSGFVEQRFKSCWNSGNLLDRVTAYAANTPYINGSLHFASTSGAAFTRTVTNGAFKTYSDSVAVPNGIGIGVFVDTSAIKRFIIRISARTGFGGRIVLQCFDASGAILTSAGANSPYVRSTGTLSYSSVYGGAWLTGSDGANNFPITFGADVQKARVIIAGGTNDAILKSIELIGLMDKQDSTGANATAALVVYSGLPGDECRMASAKPDTAGQHGYYALGQQVQNAAAAVGQPSHWTAITNAIGYLAKTWAISTAYTRAGDTVVNGANVYYLVTPGTSAGAGGPTGTGTGITDGTCVWNYLGPKAAFATSPNLV